MAIGIMVEAFQSSPILIAKECSISTTLKTMPKNKCLTNVFRTQIFLGYSDAQMFNLLAVEEAYLEWFWGDKDLDLERDDLFLFFFFFS